MNISHIPNQSGVYFFKDKSGNVLYIGKAKDLKKRISQYFSPGSIWKQEMLGKSDSVDFVIVKNESEALYLEDNLIKKHKPYYNNMLKGSNSYAYIKITNEDFPQIFITRKKILDGSTYIGPKHNTIHLKKFFQYIRQVLQYRGCKTSQFKQGKVCSDYYFALCKGRCIKQGNNETIKQLDDYNKIISYITSFFRGDINPIKKEILKQINNSIKSQNFERAAKLRDIYNNISSLSESQTVVINLDITGYIFKIKKIGKRFVYVLLYFNQGKLVDIIRHKFYQDESDIGSIISSISSECGEFKLTPNAVNSPSSQITGVQKSIKKLSKAALKDIDKLIEGFFDSYIISTSFEGENLNNDLLFQLQSRYNLKNFPYHIECIDVSHLSGFRTSGALSCFLGGLAEKKYYRRYKINEKMLQGNNSNDYASLKEIILRRFQNSDFLPNLFILDGGKGQLGIIKKIYNEDQNFKNLFSKIDFISLGKGEARAKAKIGQAGKKNQISEKVYCFDQDMNIKAQKLIYDQSDKILIKIRDEAHRFANDYRKKQMSSPRKK